MKYWIKEVNCFTDKQKSPVWEISEEGVQYLSPDYEPYPEYTDEQVEKMFADALKQNAIIKDVNGVPTIVPLPAPTAEEKQAKYENTVNTKIREKYTLSQELAILRQRDTKPEEYAAYNTYCEECKTKAKAALQ